VVALRLGIRPQAVSLWIKKDRIPAERVPQLERFASELGLPLRAEQMRKDVDWAALRCACAT
jgi:DNA-binding transcriptional regulator YdaS (Cro superfamily)